MSLGENTIGNHRSVGIHELEERVFGLVNSELCDEICNPFWRLLEWGEERPEKKRLDARSSAGHKGPGGKGKIHLQCSRLGLEEAG